jgi:RsiW-degrading membrane proteinase PrsW (M82 family)
MSMPEKKHVTPVSLAVDAILVIAFFVFMYFVLRPHVPSNNERDIAIWSGLTSACMSGVFWLCIQMFRVVYRAQKEKRS